MIQIESQADPNVVNNQPVSSIAPETPRRKRKLIWLWIILGLICAAGIAAVLFLVVFSPQGAASWGAVVPVLLLDGSDVIMMRGSEAVSLGNAGYHVISEEIFNGVSHATSVTCVNGVWADNWGVLFYLRDVDENTGEGTLMKVETAGSNPPAEIAKNVCIASVSDDGSRVLYITNMDKTGGDLMLTDGGKTELVARGVVPENIEFSHNGEYFSFLQADETSAGYKFTVCTGRSAEDIENTDEFETAGYSGYEFSANVQDSGTLVYAIWIHGIASPTQKEFSVCKYGGKPERLAEKGIPENMLNIADLYSVDNTLYYVDENGEQERIIDGFEYIGRVRGEDGRIIEGSLMLSQKGNSDGIVTMYSLTLGQDAQKICEADYFTKASPGFKWVAYTLGGELFISKRNNDGWSEGISMDKTKPFIFDFKASGRYLYFVTKENKADRNGDLYRYDTATGDKKMLKSDVARAVLVGDAVYTLDGLYNGRVYCIAPDGKETLIAEGELWVLLEGSGGLYIEQRVGNAYSLLFAPLGGNKAVEVVNKYDNRTGVTWGMEYQMPLPADVKQALDELYEDTLILLDTYNDTHLAVTDAPHRTFEENLAFADELRGRPDVPKDVRSIIEKIYNGFWDLRGEPENPDTLYNTGKDESLQYALEFLSNAVSAYDARFAK